MKEEVNARKTRDDAETYVHPVFLRAPLGHSATCGVTGITRAQWMISTHLCRAERPPTAANAFSLHANERLFRYALLQPLTRIGLRQSNVWIRRGAGYVANLSVDIHERPDVQCTDALEAG